MEENKRTELDKINEKKEIRHTMVALLHNS